jgi:Ni,Fe-hydrogenase III component G
MYNLNILKDGCSKPLKAKAYTWQEREVGELLGLIVTSILNKKVLYRKG